MSLETPSTAPRQTELIPNGRALPPLAPPPPALSAPPTMDTLWQVVRKTWPWMVLAGLLAAAVGSAGGWFLAPGKYTASVEIELPRLHGEPEGASEFAAINFQKAEAARIKSSAVQAEVLSDPAVQSTAEVKSQDDPRAWLSKDLVTDVTGPSDRIKVSLSGEHPKDLAFILDRVVEEYDKEFKKKLQARLTQRRDQLEKRNEDIAKRLRGLRQSLQLTEKDNGVEDVATKVQKESMLSSRIGSLHSSMDTLQVQLKKDEAELNSTETQVRDPATIVVPRFDVDKEMRTDPIVGEQLKELLGLESKIRQLTSPGGVVGGENSPKVQDMRKTQAQIQEALKAHHNQIEASLRDKLLGELMKRASVLQTEIRVLKDQIAGQQGQLANAEGELARLKLGIVPPPVAQKRDEVNQVEKTREKISDEIGTVETLLATATRLDVPKAMPPTSRRIDKKIKVAGVAGVGLFGVAAFAVAMMHFSKRHVYSSDDMTHGLSLNVLAGLPLASERGRKPLALLVGQAAPTADQSAMLEAVDSLRVVVQHAARTDKLRSLVVTSPERGEGKTSLACQLAASLARSGAKTLLIDADLRDPSAHDQFDLPRSPGLSEVLRGERLDAVIQPTQLECLAVLAAGQADRSSIQALTRDEVAKMLELLEEHFDFLVIDSSPVLPVADTIQLAQHADAVLLAALRGVSRLPAVYAAQQRLEQVGVRILGAVLAGDRTSSYGKYTRK